MTQTLKVSYNVLFGEPEYVLTQVKRRCREMLLRELLDNLEKLEKDLDSLTVCFEFGLSVRKDYGLRSNTYTHYLHYTYVTDRTAEDCTRSFD